MHSKAEWMNHSIRLFDLRPERFRHYDFPSVVYFPLASLYRQIIMRTLQLEYISHYFFLFLLFLFKSQKIYWKQYKSICANPRKNILNRRKQSSLLLQKRTLFTAVHATHQSASILLRLDYRVLIVQVFFSKVSNQVKEYFKSIIIRMQARFIRKALLLVRRKNELFKYLRLQNPNEWFDYTRLGQSNEWVIRIFELSKTPLVTSDSFTGFCICINLEGGLTTHFPVQLTV